MLLGVAEAVGVGEAVAMAVEEAAGVAEGVTVEAAVTVSASCAPFRLPGKTSYLSLSICFVRYIP